MRMTRSAVSERPERRHRRRSAGTEARRRWSAALVVVVAGAVTLTGTAGPALADRGHDRDKDNAFTQTNLVSDIPDLAGRSRIRMLINPWGVAFGADAPRCGRATRAATAARCTAGPAAATRGEGCRSRWLRSSPTGIVFNPTTDFVVTKAPSPAPGAVHLRRDDVQPAGHPASSADHRLGGHRRAEPQIHGHQGQQGRRLLYRTDTGAGPARSPGRYCSPPTSQSEHASTSMTANSNKVTPSRGYFVDPTY